jgi:spermidine synthase
MILFLGLFFISGFCSLVYEVVWLRLAMGVFGVTAPYVSIFLSVFMAGLGIGSWGAGRLCQRLKSKPASYTLRLYAAAEFLIALSAFAVPFALTMSRGHLDHTFANVSWGSAGYYWISGLCTTVALLPWCLCMGATFPLAMAAIEKRFQRQSRNSFSYLYLANVLGAALGAIISAYILIELYGFRQTLFIAAGFNVLIALVALAMGLHPSMGSSESAKADDQSAALGSLSKSNALPLLFLTGVVSMAMEIVWTRQYTPYLGNSVYAFAIILGGYLLATFVGSCLYRFFIKKNPAQYDLAWVVVGLMSLVPVYAADPYLPMKGFLRIIFGIMPFCLVLGYLTPSLVDRWSLGRPHRAGTAYAVNVLGCIVGPLIAGFLLLPFMAERFALAVLALPLFVAGYLAARRLNDDRVRVGRLKPWPVYIFSAVIAVVLVVISSPSEDQAYLVAGGDVQVRRDYQATVVAAGSGMRRLLLVNGIGMTKLTPITKFMAHLPMAFMPRPPQNALVICFGMGTTFRSLVSWGKQATVVELVPSVPRLFSYFHEDGQKVLGAPNAKVIIDDGRRFLSRSPEMFDVITLDPAPPMSAAGTSFLYSKEFYTAAKNRLKPDGILQQWIMEPMDPTELTAFARAIKDTFPYVRVFRSIEGWGYHCLASLKPIPSASAEVLSARLPPDATKDLVEYGPHPTALKQFATILSRELSIDELIKSDEPALGEDRPINEYCVLRRIKAKGHRN